MLYFALVCSACLPLFDLFALLACLLACLFACLLACLPALPALLCLPCEFCCLACLGVLLCARQLLCLLCLLTCFVLLCFAGVLFACLGSFINSLLISPSISESLWSSLGLSGCDRASLSIAMIKRPTPSQGFPMAGHPLGPLQKQALIWQLLKRSAGIAIQTRGRTHSSSSLSTEHKKRTHYFPALTN